MSVTRKRDRLPLLLLSSLKAKNLGRVYAFWGSLIAVVIVATLFPAVGILLPGQGGAPARFEPLNARGQKAVGQITRTEIRRLRSLALMSSPLAPASPPPQGVAPPDIVDLFGVRRSESAAFRGVTARLGAVSEACAKWIGSDQGGLPPQAAIEAEELLNSITGQAGQDRGVFLYHRGLITLCGPDGQSAETAFRQALEKYSAFASGSAPSDQERRKLAQFETVTRYGLALALMAKGAAPGEVDRELQAALTAAAGAHAHSQQPPFVEMTACRDGPNCAMFDFSTAHIFNARLFNWMRAGDPVTGYRKTAEALRGAPSRVAAYPMLASNFAAAAAAAGDGEAVQALFQSIRARLQANPETPPDAVAWGRLAAMAVISPVDIHTAGEPWPTGGQVSDSRRDFAKRTGEPASFPTIILTEPDDAGTIDLWLWIRRERQQLIDGKFEEYRKDGASLRALGPEAQDFLFAWRRETTARLGDELLQRAYKTRERHGAAAAKPMLALLAGEGFPVTVRVRAAVSGFWGIPWMALFWRVAGVLMVLGLLAWAHLTCAAAYRHVFTDRHHRERLAQRAGLKG